MKFLLLLALVCLVGGSKVRYDGYKVYKLQPSTSRQLDIINNVQEKMPAFDFWKNHKKVGENATVMVPPAFQATFVNLLKANKIQFDETIEDVQKLIDEERIVDTRGSMTWTEYHTLDSIHSWLDELAKEYKQVTVVSAGTSYEKRNLKGIKIAYGTGKKVVIIEGDIHAREWISPATVTYIINEILTSTDPTWRKIAESFEWHIFPVVNPDGYAYTASSNRMWRKTRQPYGTCYGADPNRNWDAHWLEQGASANPCDDTHAGSKPFSEIEMASLSKYISTVGTRSVGYFSFHSYGQMMLLPYGHTTAHLDNYDEAMIAAKACVTAIAKKYGTSYKYGNVAETIYPASGGSIDWVKQEYGTPLVYAFELRDTGKYGFILPANLIVPTASEIMDGLTALFLKGEELGYFTLG